MAKVITYNTHSYASGHLCQISFITLIHTIYEDTMTHTCISQTNSEAKYATSIYLMINLSQMSQNELKCLVW